MTGVKQQQKQSTARSGGASGLKAPHLSIKARATPSNSNNWILTRYPVHNSTTRLADESESSYTPIAEATQAKSAAQEPKEKKQAPLKATKRLSFRNNMVKAKKTAVAPDSGKASNDSDLLYGLYKQATVGDAPKRKFSFSKKQKTKKKAWKQLQDIPEEKLEEALLHVSKALEILKLEKDSNSSIDLGLGKQSAVEEPESASEGETAGDSQEMSPEERLLAAAADNDTTTIRALLDRGVDKNARDECGQTALHMAADNGAENALQVLLDNGASVESSDQHGVSVLQAAVIAGHVEICKILLDKGADPEQQDEDGDSPFTCAMDDGSPEMQDLFDDGEEEEEEDHFEAESTISWDTEFTMAQPNANGYKIIDRTPSLLGTPES